MTEQPTLHIRQEAAGKKKQRIGVVLKRQESLA
jgi:hypothetical protein